ncbi:MAG: hypothetical protein WC831_01850 [Parcubacteria group bacterium]|jgi:hypothetical protein
MRKQKTKTFFAELISPIKNLFNHDQEPLLHTIEWVFILFAFFIIGFSVIYYQNTIKLYEKFSDKFLGSKEALIQTPEEEKLFTGEVVPEPVDTTDWDAYQNKWYGFEIKHPDSWKNNTQYKTATEKSAVYETIYKFRKEGEGTDEAFAGYDVKIYLAKKVQKIENTNDVHKKDGAPEDAGECPLPSEEIKSEGNDLELQKISIDDINSCYEPAYFYSIAKGDYIYNIVPAVSESGERYSNPEKETSVQFPEYKEAVNSFGFIPVVRPQSKPKPKITARKPVAAKLVNGKLVCAKKNDKPHKSKKKSHKPGHLDLECCLDPDETPNPWCTY